jgi:hypothetical protein
MSKSYHETRKDLKNKTKKEIECMVYDVDSVLHRLVEKNMIKKEVIKKRREAKRSKKNKS